MALNVESIQTQVGQEWTWVELSSSAPPGTQTARVYVAAEVGSQAWFDGTVFFSGQPELFP